MIDKVENDSEIRRLVLAKKIYLHGCNHAFVRDEVSRMLVLHHFDNAIEIVLKCIATKYGIISSSKQEYKFKELWNEIAKQVKNLPLKDQIFTLHDLRNIVQHQGDIPAIEAVIKYKGCVEDFFKEICSKIFNISYERLYLSELIKNGRLRKKISEAEKAFEKKEYKECLELCDDTLIVATFEEADIHFTSGMLTGYWGGSEELSKVISDDFAEKYKDKDFYELAEELRKAILQLSQAAIGMQFLDEYRMDFLKNRQIIKTLDDLSHNELKDNAEFSLNFVTDLILKWQEEGIFGGDEKNKLSSSDIT